MRKAAKRIGLLRIVFAIACIAGVWNVWSDNSNLDTWKRLLLSAVILSMPINVWWGERVIERDKRAVEEWERIRATIPADEGNVSEP
jgi:hypothetical protein